MKIRKTKSDAAIDTALYALLAVIALIAIYPLYFILISSISDPDAVNSGKVILFPVGFTMGGYVEIFKSSQIWTGYKNTMFYTVLGTLLNVVITLLTAYPLSRRDLVGKNHIMRYFVFTMYFSGGLIPLYILVQDLRLVNSPFVLIILGSLSVFNMIIARTFFVSTISQELLEAAYLDGCSNFKFFASIVLPLSKAIIAVLLVFYGVGHWNEYFSALIFLSKKELLPLQMILRQILIQNAALDISASMDTMQEILLRREYAELIKYGSIIVSSVPVLVLYPFAQRYFVKGVMIGAIKG